MKNLIVIIFLIAAGEASAQYYSRYHEMGMMVLGAESEPVNWDAVDTTELFRNDHMMAFGTIEVFTNDRYAYMEASTYKSNIPGAQGQQDRYLIDYKEAKMYDLNQKTFTSLVRPDLPEMKKTKTITNLKMSRNGREVVCMIDPDIPGEIRNRLIVSKPLPGGVREITTPVQKVKLLSWSKRAFDFEDVLKEAELCKDNNKSLDPLFR